MSPAGAQLRIHGKVPHVEAIQRSYAMMVRNAMLARLKAMSFFQGFEFRRSHSLVLGTGHMPMCCVYFLKEDLMPDGNANTGEVRFDSEVRIGFSVFLINNDPDETEDRLDDAYQVIFQGLLRDSTLYHNSQFQIESFSRGSRQHFYGSMPQANETPYAEMRAELTCNLGAIEYEPIEEDMLETVHVETVHPPGADEDEVQRIYSVYDVDMLDKGDDDNG
jgi:hypothetical protein